MLCAPQGIAYLLDTLNRAVLTQQTIAFFTPNLLLLQEKQDPNEEENIKFIQQSIESNQLYLQDLIYDIHAMAQENKHAFKNDEQLNDFVAQINKNNFKKAFAILESKTIMSSSLQTTFITIGDTADTCVLGANFSLVLYAIAANQPVF